MEKAMHRDDVIRKHTIGELEAFLAAVDRLLAMPGPHLDPAVTPHPSRRGSFYERYDELRNGMKRDFGDTFDHGLPTRRFHERRGGGAPVGGSLLRDDVQAMREDVEACLVSVRTPRDSSSST